MRWRAVAAFATVIVALSSGAVVAVVPGDEVVSWVPAGAAAASVLVVGGAMRGTGRAAPRWRLLAVGVALWAGGRIAQAQQWESSDAPDAPPTVTDAPILAGLAVVAAALMLASAARTGRADWIARLDATVTGAAAALVGVVLLAPAVDDADLSGPATWTLAATGLVAVLLAAATLRLAVTRARRLPSGRFLIAGALLLASGLALGALGHLDLGGADLHRWSASLTSMGALAAASAALHPTAARITDRERRSAHELPPPRLVLLAVATAAGPLSAALQHLRGEDPQAVAVGVGTAFVVGLLAVRLELVVRASRSQAAREQVVAELAAELAGAGDAADVRQRTLEAGRRLAGRDLSYVAWVDINERGVMSPEAVLGPRGTVDRATLGVEGAVEVVPVGAAPPVRRLDSAGRPVLIVAVPCRIAPPAALALALTDSSGDELDATLAVVAAQAALALDAIVKAEELQERRAEARFQQLVRHATDALILLGRDGRVRYQSPSVVRVLGYLTVDLDGATLERVVHPDDADHFASFLAQLIHGAPEAVRTLDVQMLRADGSTIQAEIVGTNLLDNPHLQGVALTVRDVSGRRALEDQLRHQAFHDPLTGLANRALFADRVEHALDRIRRSDSPTPAVVFIDLDDFKLVNDRFGHGAGDELLCVVADRLRGCLRTGDTPARLGGDEFAVLLEDAHDLQAIIEVGERILDALHESITIGGNALAVSASLGIATRQGPDTTPDELLRNADLAMYSAKSSGKGHVELFEAAMHRRAVERLSIGADLEHAIERGELTVAYQPIVDLRARTPVAFEALARWNHPERGAVPPAEFLRVAEHTGTIVPLGRTILAKACGQLAAWLAANPDAGWHMSVNLSAAEVLHPELIPTLLAATDEAGLEPSSLMVELGESVLLSDSEQVLRRLHQLKDAGVQVAIDDFGTGYSSVSYLQRVPFDVLKIDRTFVAALRQEEPATSLVRTILDLSRTLGRVAVAEGIEEQVELDGLLELGCGLGQGTLLVAPADATSLEQSLGIVSPRA